jgi:hypothetical protein
LQYDIRLAKQDAEQKIIQMLGVNPYAQGASIQPEFSSEVNQIASKSGVTVAQLGNELTNLYSRCFRKMLVIGWMYDDEEFCYRYQNQLICFGYEYPIQPFLKDRVTCQVSMGINPNDFQTQQQALQAYQSIVLSGVGETIPELKKLVLQRYVNSLGIRGAEILVEQALSQQQAAQQAAMAAQQPAGPTADLMSQLMGAVSPNEPTQ